MMIIRPITVTDSGAFTRASSATYYNLSGLLTTATTNEPRYNFDPSDLTIPPILLMEDAATNYLAKSTEIDAWTLTNATVSANSQNSPTGANTADRLLADATLTSQHHAEKVAAAVSAGAQVAASVFLHSGGITHARFEVHDTTTGAGFGVIVDLLAGEITFSGTFGTGAVGVSATIQNLPGNWHRCVLVCSVPGATTYAIRVYGGDGDTSFSGDGVAGVDVYGGQVELGAVSSFIPTTTTSATRAVDVNTKLMLSNVAETEPVYSTATTYAKDVVVRGNTAETAHTTFQSLQATNLNKPLSDEAWWLNIGATNPWRMFDQSVNSQTNNTEFIAVNIRTADRVDSVVLLNVSAATVRVTMVDDIDGTVYDKSFSLVSTAGVDDWYDYFFEPIVRATDIAITDLPAYAGATVTVTMSDPGFGVTCGACIIGLKSDLGLTQYGAQVGIQDYSIKQRDAYGNFTILERAFSNRGSFQVYVPAGQVDQIKTMMASFRATPIVYIGSELYTSTMIYGFYKDFNLEIAYQKYSLFTLEIEGLT